MNWEPLLVLENKTIAVDFDGTIVEDSFPDIGKPKQEIINWLKNSKEKGCKLILWTCRSNNIKVENKGALDIAVTYCKEVLGLEFDAVNENLKEVKEKWDNDTRKVLADYYLDDKAITVL